jgi:hypothetical protein
MKAKTIKAVPVKKDGSVFAIVLLDENGNEATIEFPATGGDKNFCVYHFL